MPISQETLNQLLLQLRSDYVPLDHRDLSDRITQTVHRLYPIATQETLTDDSCELDIDLIPPNL